MPNSHYMYIYIYIYIYIFIYEKLAELVQACKGKKRYGLGELVDEGTAPVGRPKTTGQDST